MIHQTCPCCGEFHETSACRTAARVGSSDGFGGSVFLANLHHMCAQTDGTYRFPNSREGDILKTAKREIEALRHALENARLAMIGSRDYCRSRALAHGGLDGCIQMADDALSPNVTGEPRARK